MNNTSTIARTVSIIRRFTVVEMLVVLAIIMTLVGILVFGIGLLFLVWEYARILA